METKIMDEWAQKILKRIGTQDALSAARKHKYFTGTIRFPMSVPSFWDGGSRSYWHFYKLSTGQCITLPSNHPAYEPGRPYTLKDLPDDCLLVETGVFCGKAMTAHFHIKAAVAVTA
jgi:hypothetical protein